MQLDRALDANAAKEQAQSDVLALVLSVTLFTVLAAFVVARSRSDGEGGTTLGA